MKHCFIHEDVSHRLVAVLDHHVWIMAVLTACARMIQTLVIRPSSANSPPHRHKNTLSNHSGHRHFPYMTQCGISYIFLFRFVVNSATSILHCESPISFPRRIVPRRRTTIDRIGFARAGMASIASKAIQPKRPPPSPSREVVNRRQAHRRALPVDALSDLSPRRPSSGHIPRLTHAIIRRIVIDDDQTKVSSCVFPFSRDTKIC